ncbi:MAG: tetratricopeptide repeat protein [Bacteroidia bacterium]|nr:tetratricopeptide repeat protein [Bacteroidia bacterium]
MGMAASNWFCGNDKVESPDDIARNRTSYAGLSDSARYVGMNACTGCHSDIHKSYMHTGMGMSFDKAGKSKSAGNFSGHPNVFDPYRNMNYHPYWKGEELFFLEFRLEGKDTVYRREEKIAYIVGSGQHTNSHIWESNGYLFQAPLTFYTQKGKWDLPPGFEQGNNTRFNRLIGLECMSCHNAYPEFAAGSENKFKAVKNGIDCERCHGPGSIHVAEKSRGILIDTASQIDYSIVNPSKLPIDLQFDVCQRCHIQGNAVLKEGKSFFDFKPGMPLSSVMDVYMPVYAGREEEHIMASHAERLKMSTCFKASSEKLKGSREKDLKPFRKGLTCITCHNPHISVKKSGAEHFNSACRNCHDQGKEVMCSEKPSLRLKSQDNCTGCHMPQHGTVDIPHVRVHDHRIAIPKDSVNTAAIKQFIGINCINNPRPDALSKAVAFIQYVEKFGMEKSMLDSAMNCLTQSKEKDLRTQFPLLVHIAYLKGDFSKISDYLNQVPDILASISKTSLDNRDAWTSYRVGEACQHTGRNRDALLWFRNASLLAPLNPEFANKYANALVSAGRYKEAERIFTDLNAEHPDYAPAFCNRGFLLLSQQGDATAALRLFDKALQLDPDYELALLNKASVFIVQGKVKEARRILTQVLRINPANGQALEGLKRIGSLK